LIKDEIKNINNKTEEKQDDNEQFVGNRKVYPCHICLRLLRTEIGLKNHMTIHYSYYNGCSYASACASSCHGLSQIKYHIDNMRLYDSREFSEHGKSDICLE
jgi:hypothetical protein